LFTRERAEESERSQLCAAKRVMLSGDGERGRESLIGEKGSTGDKDKDWKTPLMSSLLSI